MTFLTWISDNPGAAFLMGLFAIVALFIVCIAIVDVANAIFGGKGKP
jgi:hypothetical protein